MGQKLKEKIQKQSEEAFLEFLHFRLKSQPFVRG